jgi:hypothetical protein
VSAEAVAAASAASAATASSRLAGSAPVAAAERTLLVLELAGTEPGALAAALGESAYEAAQRLRRGGFQLHKVLATEQAGAELERLQSHGLRVLSLPEAELKTPPLGALGGRFEAGTLELRVERGRLRLETGALLLVVRGPIAREYQARTAKKGLALASLEAGYRFHLHLRAEPGPVEIDPWAFEFGPGSEAGRPSLLTLTSWVEQLAQGVSVDDGFRRLPPALAPQAESEAQAAALLRRSQERKDAALVLDNVAQFRFYSAWRAAVERRRRS